MKIFVRFCDEKTGNIAVMMGLLAPVLLGIVAISTDYVVIYSQTSKLQQAADSAALSGAKELGIAGTDQEEVNSIAKSYVHINFFGSETDPDITDLAITSEILPNGRGVTVDLKYYWEPFFLHYFDSNILPIHVTASAGLAGTSSICTLALDPSSNASISIIGEANLLARRCSIQANSNSSSAIAVDSGSKITSNSICSSGGYSGAPRNFDPMPIIDCPPLADPLRDRQLPGWSGGCRERHLLAKGKRLTISPGVYCGGITLVNKAEVTLLPGTYIIVDGDLDVASGSKLTGNRVNIHFEKNARMILRNNTTISLTAPNSGEMAGILISSGRTNDPNLQFEIHSQDARKLTGLLYLPNNTLKIGDDADNDSVCDTDEFDYRIDQVHPRLHDHFHEHPDGTVHRHVHVIAEGGPKDIPVEQRGPIHRAEYFHSHEEKVDCFSNVGAHSDWTAIVARNIALTAGVQVVLNANYENSPIPVPENDGMNALEVNLTE